MRRLFRWAFNLCAAGSAVLFMGACVLWVRSEWVGDQWVWYDRDCGGCFSTLTLACGRVRYAWTDDSHLDGLNPPAGHATSRNPCPMMYPVNLRGVPHYQVPGFRFDRYPGGIVVTLHHALPTLLSLPLPLAWLRRRWMPRRRAKAGLCLVCGYDLRATPEVGPALLGRCPECGTERAVAGTKA